MNATISPDAQIIEIFQEMFEAALIIGAVGLLLLAGIFVVLLWQVIASRRERNLPQGLSQQMMDVQSKLATVERMLREVG